MDFEIRPFHPVDEEYQACLAVQACYPEDRQDTLDEWKYVDKTARKDALRVRFVLVLDSAIIGYGVVADPYWLDVKDRIQFAHTVHPDHEGLVAERKPIHDHVERYVLSVVSDRPVKVLLTHAREDNKVKVGWLTDNGYRTVRRSPSSSLDVAAFDFGKWGGCVENVEASGIVFLSRAYLQKHDPDWHAKLYGAWVEIKLDAPTANERRPISVDEFDRMLNSPAMCPETNLIAVDNGARAASCSGFGPYAGLTFANPSLHNSTIWGTRYTGVRRAWRRRGIATAIKLKSIAQGRDMGCVRMRTSNEENNPMYGINSALGFESGPAWKEYKKLL
ncbi:MAG: GNAT family N-acetyltransferase [Caldilineaceae bacterium SB0664_bin_22]|nr:GNAT family N-acetyltransferase [Caldilineaceae bacterium SB0664_bin_22]